MADKSKKEQTPPPLLLMPAGGGLTLTPPDQPSMFMPVVQAEPSLFGPEEDVLGEADSFVGQSPPQPVQPGSDRLGATAPTSLFQGPTQTGGHRTTPDPFSQVSQGSQFRPSPSHTPPMGGPLANPASTQGMAGAAQRGTPPLVPTSQVPVTGGAQMSSVPPMPNASGLQGLYRKHGSSRYAQMPAGTYANNSGMPMAHSPATLMGSPPAPTPFSQNFSSEAATLDLGSTGSGSMASNIAPPTLPTQPSIGPMSGMGYVPSATGTYVPMTCHWCYCKDVEGRNIWYPVSMTDNMALEDALKSGNSEVIVPIEGGRYDVNLQERKLYSVYWEEEPKVIKRCSWFYKREGDNRYVPYEEPFCIKLEEEYKSAVTTGVWHKPLQFDSGETVVMHNPSVMVHYTASSQPDEWGNVQVSTSAPLQGDQQRPRIVKRGVGDFDIEDGESRQIDHLVFVVHGIGSVCDLRFRSIVECVDDFRSISQTLLSSHFTEHVESHRIGRVEFLPIQWHMALHGDATGIDARMKAITLPSTPKLRNFVNDTLMDILFYTSPTYCQCIADTVGSEINRLYDLFMSRNQQFKGAVSVAGHSLGSCILFDLLQHQGDTASTPVAPDNSQLTNGHQEPVQPITTQEPVVEDVDDVADDGASPELSLEDLLARVGLQEKLALFQEEQIDMDTLEMLSDSDLKDLGLAMGPRKKLQGLMREQQNKKDKQQQAAERKRRAEEDRQLREQLAAEMAAQQQQQSQTPSSNASHLSVDYIVGTGGTGQPEIRYTQLRFEPVACFALGSPIGLFLSARGMSSIGEEFRLPTCGKYFNIFHPFDPVAYRLEPLINPSVGSVKPVLMPHHKGRKRLHLELKENLARMGADIKQRIVDSLKSTWTSINNFARAHQTDGQSIEQQVETEMSQVRQQLEDDSASVASGFEEDVYIGQLNEGRRVDYVLQERPIESFNDYMFSLTSHGCYWNSEDTVLLVLKEIYALYGIAPLTPGAEAGPPKAKAVPPPPKAVTSPYGPPLGQNSGIPQGPPSGPLPGPPTGYTGYSGYSSGMGGVNSGSINSNSMRPPQGPPPTMFNPADPSMGTPSSSGIPPMSLPSNPPSSYSMAGPPQRPPLPATQGLSSGGIRPPSGPPPFNMGGSSPLVTPGIAAAPLGPPPMGGFMKKS